MSYSGHSGGGYSHRSSRGGHESSYHSSQSRRRYHHAEADDNNDVGGGGGGGGDWRSRQQRSPLSSSTRSSSYRHQHGDDDFADRRGYARDGERGGGGGYAYRGRGDYDRGGRGGWSGDHHRHQGNYRYDDRSSSSSRYQQRRGGGSGGDEDFGMIAAGRRGGFGGGGGGGGRPPRSGGEFLPRSNNSFYRQHLADSGGGRFMHQPSLPPPPPASAAAPAAASAYEPILCPSYNWTMPDCRDQACKQLHICRNWLGGECSRADCRLSHCLADGHNWPKFQGWLSDRELAEIGQDRDSSATNHRLRAWLFDKLPKICPSSLVPRLVCHSPRCRDLHVCVNIVKSNQCRYRQHCCSPYHNLFLPRNLDILRRYYPSISAHVDPTRSHEEQVWLSDVLKNDMDKPAPAGFDEHHFKLRGLTIDTVQLCLNHGEGRGECADPTCRDLHVCRAWLGGACPAGRACRWAHGFTDDVVERLEKLVDNGKKLDCQYNIRDNLKVVFPCTCCYYNTDRGCERGSHNCDYLHLCNAYLRGNKDCRCRRNHDPFRGCVPQRLARKGVDISQPEDGDTSRMLRNVLYADLRVRQPCPNCSGGPPSRTGSRSRSPSRSRSRSSRRRSSKPTSSVASDSVAAAVAGVVDDIVVDERDNGNGDHGGAGGSGDSDRGGSAASASSSGGSPHRRRQLKRRRQRRESGERRSAAGSGSDSDGSAGREKRQRRRYRRREASDD